MLITISSILINVDDGKLTISSLSLDTNNFMLAKAYQSQLDSSLTKIRENSYIILKKTTPHIDLTDCDSSASRILVGPIVYWLRSTSITNFSLITMLPQ